MLGPSGPTAVRRRAPGIITPSPPTKSSGFRGFDSSRLLIPRGGIIMSVNFDRGSPRKFDSRTLNRETLDRWTGRSMIRIIIVMSIISIISGIIIVTTHITISVTIISNY